MIWDWDLWPWRLVGAYGSEYLLLEYRMQRNLDSAQVLLGALLYPALRPVVQQMKKILDANT